MGLSKMPFLVALGGGNLSVLLILTGQNWERVGLVSGPLRLDGAFLGEANMARKPQSSERRTFRTGEHSALWLDQCFGFDQCWVGGGETPSLSINEALSSKYHNMLHEESCKKGL